MEKLEEQSVSFENIKALCVNYRKDSSTRKTVEYLNKRLSSLESQWIEFDNRHALLVLELEDKNTTYFTDDVYGKIKEMYVTTKTDITNKLAEKTKPKQVVTFDLSGTSTAEEVEIADDAQLLLKRQECNFNSIYRTISKINNACTSEKWELDDNLATLRLKWEPIDKLHWQIDFHLKGTNEHYYNMFSDVERKYDDLKRKLNAKIWATAHYQKSAPKIEIPEFSGNYTQWISFKDLFLETIHKNPSINNAQKMQHLKTKLRGEAERLVQHLTISAENYNSCWDILNQRYDNRRLQFTTFTNTMLNLPVIQQPDSFNLKRIHDTITECLNGVANIGIDTSTWDPIIVHIMSQKLDSNTLSDYMKELQDHRELRNLQDFLSFLETQFMAYETMKSAKKGNTTTSEKSFNNKMSKQTPMKTSNFKFNKTYNYYATHGKCPHCNGTHVLMQCDKFLEMDTWKRTATVTKLKLCKNCLYSHGTEECKSNKTCRECNLKHHTLLHNSEKRNIACKKPNSEPSTSSLQQPTSNHLQNNNLEVLLTTVQLKVRSVDGTYVTLRALLDQGSQVNLITENAAQILRLPRKRMAASVTGIGSVSSDCRGQLNISCTSIHSDYSFGIQALIMKTLTNSLPTKTFEKICWPHLENLKLADPEFNISRPIDILLGADIYSEIILDGVLKGNMQTPVAQQTKVGWILCGKMRTLSCHVTVVNLEELTKFWETEEIQSPEDLPNNDYCEQFYKDTVQRSQDGKYIVKMPMCPNYEEKLGNSKSIAISQYLQLEKRLVKTHKLSAMYKEFMNEYAEYMLVTEDDLKHCLQQKWNHFLCNKNLPSFDLHSNNAPCDVEHASCKDGWKELHSPNTWLTICCDTCSLRIICDNDVTSYSVSSSSIISLSEGCVLQSKDLTIYAHRHYNTRTKMDYEFTIPTIDTSINSVVNLTYHKVLPKLQSGDVDLQITKIEDTLAAQKKNEVLQSSTAISSHDVHQYVISYVLFASAIIALVVVVGKKRCRSCSPNRPSNLHCEEIELQEYRTAVTASSNSDVISSLEVQPETSRRNLKNGRKNLTFSFD